MNIVERLLKIDPSEIKMPKKVVKLKLKKLGDEEFEFPIEAIRPDILSEIKQDAMVMTGNKKGKISMDIVLYATQCRVIIEGCPSVFKNDNLIKKFGVHTGKELIGKLMLTGEIDKLNEEIEELSGYDEEEDKEEIKN